MKNIYINLRKLAQAKLPLVRVCSIIFLKLSWSRISKPNDLKSRLQSDLERLRREEFVDPVFEGSGIPEIYRKWKRMRIPCKPIPSCSGFEKETDSFDWIFELFGLMVRSRPERTLIRNWRNGRANRYLFIMFRYLGRLRDAGDMERYWKLGFRLMRSHVYQVSAFNYVYHNWHRNMSLGEALSILERTKELCHNQATEIKFHRTYIPKKESEELGPENARPLGVPSPEWRVYLHMLNNLIVWSRTGKEGSQHAYFPQRGVATAWEEILTQIQRKEWRYIYEFDLTKFFDRVDLQWNRNLLCTWLRYPVPIADWFKKLNQSVPRFPSELLIPEPDRSIKLLPSGKLTVNYEDKPLVLVQHHSGTYGNSRLGTKVVGTGIQVVFSKSMLNPENIKKLAQLSPEEFFKYLDEQARVEEVPETAKLGTTEQLKQIGVPQGAATSCGLSTVNVKHLTNDWQLIEDGKATSTIVERFGRDGPFKMYTVMYADDGIVFSDSAQCVEALDRPVAGVEVSKSKSRWLKYDGDWKVDKFKFLGLEYIPSTGYLIASTRKGARLALRERDLFLGWLLEQRDWLLKTALKRQANFVRGEVSPAEGGVQREYVGDAVKYEGSAEHLNSRIPESLRDWINQEYATFVSYPTPLLRLMRSKWRGIFISAMYNNSWTMSPPQDFSLKPVKNSWCQIRWPGYRYANQDHLWSEWDYSAKRAWNLSRQVLQEVSEVERWVKEWSPRPDVLRQLEATKKSAQRTMSSAYRLVRGSEVKLNIWNASSFACDDLIRNWPLDRDAASISALVKKAQRKGKPLTEQAVMDRVKARLGQWEGGPLHIRYYYQTPKRGSRKGRTLVQKAEVKMQKMVTLLAGFSSDLLQKWEDCIFNWLKEKSLNFWNKMKSWEMWDKVLGVLSPMLGVPALMIILAGVVERWQESLPPEIPNRGEVRPYMSEEVVGLRALPLENHTDWFTICCVVVVMSAVVAGYTLYYGYWSVPTVTWGSGESAKQCDHGPAIEEINRMRELAAGWGEQVNQLLEERRQLLNNLGEYRRLLQQVGELERTGTGGEEIDRLKRWMDILTSDVSRGQARIQEHMRTISEQQAALSAQSQRYQDLVNAVERSEHVIRPVEILDSAESSSSVMRSMLRLDCPHEDKLNGLLETNARLADQVSNVSNLEARVSELEALIKHVHSHMGVGPYGRGNIGMNQQFWNTSVVDWMDKLGLISDWGT